MIKNSPQSRKPQVFLCLLVLLAWLNRVMWRHSSKGKNVSGKEWAFPFLTSNSQGPCFKRRCPGKTTNSFRLFSLMAQVSWDSAPPNLYLVRRKRCPEKLFVQPVGVCMIYSIINQPCSTSRPAPFTIHHVSSDFRSSALLGGNTSSLEM